MQHRTQARLATFAVALFTTLLTAQADEPQAKSDAPSDVNPDWQTKFNEIYRLADGENARLIQPPFVPERQTYHQQNHSQIAQIPGQYGFHWKGGKVEQRYWSTDPGTVASALYMADIDVADLDGLRDTFDVKVPGDWIVRHGVRRDALLADIQRELTKATKGRIRVEPAQIEKDVIVARGRFALKPLDNAPRNPDSVHLYTDKLDPQEGAGGGTGTMAEFLRRIGDAVNQKVINETEPQKEKVEWTNNHSLHEAEKSPEKRDQVLKNVSEQTSLQFTIERRTVNAWKVIDTTNQAGGL